MGIVAARAEAAPAGAYGSWFPGVGDTSAAGMDVPPGSDLPTGYVEEEFFVSGAVDGLVYRTSLVVRKPSDPKAFSGVVLFETVRTTGHVPMWIQAKPLLMRGDGHGYAMVCSQKAGLDETVKPHNPERYAGLDIEVPSADELPPVPPEQADRLAQTLLSPRSRLMIQADHQMALTARETELAFPVSNAIQAQVGMLVKSNAPGGPFAGLDVKHLILGGASQTGYTTLRFMRDAHDAARMPDGSHIFDGLYPGAMVTFDPVGPMGVPTIHAIVEGDMFLRPKTYRRDDSDAPGDQSRLYELAGAAHFPTRGLKDLSEISTFRGMPGPEGDLSQLASPFFYVAALHNLIEWVTKGIKAPYAERIQIDDNGDVVRDEHGNACGGVRFSQIDVPTATYRPYAPGAIPDIARLIGIEEPFSSAALRKLYRDHDDYVTKVEASLSRLVRERWLLQEHADELLAEAKASPIP